MLRTTVLRIAIICAAGAALYAQPGRLFKGRQWMEIVLERKEGSTWRAVDPGLVLDSGDLIRFRFRANFDGHLYVINAGTSGEKSLLFPLEATGLNNRVSALKSYLVPSSENAMFRVAGPAGHDVVYWLVSPTPLSSDLPRMLMRDSPARPPTSMTPRCNDAIPGARSRCIDSSAGPRNPSDGTLPESLQSIPERTRRELVIVQDKEAARVSSPEPLSGPVIYEFRVAHR